jgi:zinc protease
MYKFPQTYDFRLDNGLHVICVPDHEQQAITVALQVMTGEFSDPMSLEGVTELTAGLIQKGTADLTPEQLSDRLERTGATMFAETGDEHIIFGFRALSRYVNIIMPLFRDMICTPRFDIRELDRLKKEMLTAMMAETSDPNTLANRHFFSHLCGRNHPAGRLHTVNSVKHIRMEHIREYYGSLISPKNSLLIIAGDCGNDTGTELAGLFSSWNTNKNPEPFISGPVDTIKETVIKIVDKSDITQTYFMIGHPAPGELIPARNALALANYCLGGGNFSSRLMESIRSSQGKTYGISSQIMTNRNCGIFYISTATQSSQTAEVLHTIIDVYKKFCNNGMSGAELDKAKEFVIGNMAFQLEGIGNVTDKLLWLNLYERDISYIEHFDEIVSSITIDDVNSAIRSSLASEYFSIVAVGRKDIISRQLADFGRLVCVNYRKSL